jgi:hypothetical protein
MLSAASFALSRSWLVALNKGIVAGLRPTITVDEAIQIVD